KGDMVKRCIIIANRGAGSFSSAKLESACRSLENAGMEVEQVFCSDFAAMAETAGKVSAPDASPLVIAAGGDGTINAVLNGLVGNRAACAILPLGTANVLALELGLNSAEKAVERIIAGETRPFTAGLIRGESRSSRFFLMAGIGLDGFIVRGVTLARKKSFGKGAYILSALEHLLRWEGGRLRVITENADFSCHSLVVCNAARYGGQFTLSRGASIFSPVLELVAVTGSSRLAHLGLVRETLLEGRRGAAGIVRLNAEKIRIEGIKPLQADGDDWGDSPVDIVAEKEYARIIV
ncbi:MAG TPA: diacylglycerol kinase family protein, partial [Geobacteraceae bacterium]|nr:diacylglycerol kinase family protein [Geobacteraceae bacterium]